MPLPLLRSAVAAAGDPGGPWPGPAPWDGRAWAGALLYSLLFLAALAGIAALLRGAPGGGAGGGAGGGGEGEAGR
ncbi:MAG: hypothetical protein L6R43_06990 [Planctomycetes bacterium]|nr:hypothetical protein [Planctomycetota bacterium]